MSHALHGAIGWALLTHTHTLFQPPNPQELDTTNVKILAEPSRVTRLARGSGRSPGEVLHLIEVGGCSFWAP